MDQEIPLTKIRTFVEQFIAQWPEIFLVDISISSSNKVTVLLDADSGLDIGKCAEINRAVYKMVDSEKLFPDDNFSLEISSPGIDRPLKLHRQFVKNIGRNVEVAKTDTATLTGKLTSVNEKEITIEVIGKTKKKQEEKTIINIPFNDIRQVKVLVVF